MTRPLFPAARRTLLTLLLSLACAPVLSATSVRFVSLQPSDTPGEWVAVVVAARGGKDLVFRADTAPLTASIEPPSSGQAGDQIRVRLKGVPAGVSRFEVGKGKDTLAAIPAGAVDRARAPWAEWTIYHVMVEMFANGNPGNDGEIKDWKHPNYAGGDLQGILEKSAYLQELGVNAVWLSPIFLSRTSHGYDVLNYYKIGNQFAVPNDPQASLELFRRLAKDLHGRGIKVILDIPLNHAHGSYERDETGDPGKLDPKATRARQEAEKVWESWGGSYRYWSFDDPPTRRFLKDVALHWLTKEDVDGIRLDYVRGVPHDFWAELYAEVKKAKPEAFLVGEAWIDAGGPEANAKDIATYYEKVGGAPQFDSLLEFPLQYVATEVFAKGNPAVKLEEILQETEALYGPGALPSRFLDNHDMARFLSWTSQPQRLVAAVGFLASLSGPAILFYGTETGLSHGGPKTGFTDASRIPMAWNNLDRELGDAVRAILKARAAHPALSRGGRLPLMADKDSVVFAKVAPEETALVAVNLSAAPRRLDLDVTGLVPKGTKLTPVIGSGTAETAADTGRLRWILPPLSTSVVALPAMSATSATSAMPAAAERTAVPDPSARP